MSAIDAALAATCEPRDLTVDESHAVFSEIMEGGVDELRIAGLLVGLRVKGETSDELVGAARAMQERCTRVECRTTDLLDTCGTGGDGLHTFNISTATAIVVAAAGVPIAKHGNKSVTSSSGSSEVLQSLGVNLQLSAEQVARCIDEVGIGFCFAPLHHSAMKHVAGVRKGLGVRTIFNLLGPLVNPAGAAYQLLGASSVANARLLAGALAHLGRKRAVVVCGNDELDEVALWGCTTAFEVTPEGIIEHTWTPETIGLPGCSPDDLRVESSEQSADVIRGILADEATPARHIVLANAAAALWTVGKAASLPEGVAQAARAIESGAAEKTLAALVEMSNV